MDVIRRGVGLRRGPEGSERDRFDTAACHVGVQIDLEKAGRPHSKYMARYLQPVEISAAGFKICGGLRRSTSLIFMARLSAVPRLYLVQEINLDYH
jgi:hypothetical protein